ncbi:hypothetical protein B0H13DRAFT_1906518 [Mycena leptocephala]|nr:hypothetical protein B0H13DRAFT_1906518 [Mycena leptocephala]
MSAVFAFQTDYLHQCHSECTTCRCILGPSCQCLTLNTSRYSGDSSRRVVTRGRTLQAKRSFSTSWNGSTWYIIGNPGILELKCPELKNRGSKGVSGVRISFTAVHSGGAWWAVKLWISGKHAGLIAVLGNCRVVERNPGNCKVQVIHPGIIRVSIQELTANHVALERRFGTSITFHGFRIVLRVPVWADDVSGVTSKRYHKHLNSYTANANLPGQLLQQEYFVRFVCTSPHAGALMQLKVVVNQVEFRLNVPDGPADNPQQAEEASHIGHQGNYFCRRYHVGGTNEQKECPDGYHSFYAPGRPRNMEGIRGCVLAQLRLATYGIASRVEELQASTGTKDKIAQHWIDILIQTAREAQAASPGRSVDDLPNELLVWLGNKTDQPYNHPLDVPYTLVEILHTILLGNAKYTWYDLHHNWTAAQQDTFTVRLQGTNLDGLRVPPIRTAYMMQYRNGLIRKHFKILMQTMIFHIHDIVTPDQFSLVRALGELGPLLWIPVIDNMEEYLRDLKILIDNLLDVFTTLDPTKTPIKLKLHVLVHIVQDIRRQGPAVRLSTEVFKCFNAIFRLCSVPINHQAPSRDIAAKFADLDRVKHIMSGGYWYQDAAWVRAGRDVRRILRNTPIIQKHLGRAPPPFWTPGLIKLTALTADEAMLNGATNPASLTIDASMRWTNGVNVAAVSGNCCTVGSWTVFRVNDLPMIARVSKILLPRGSKSGVLVITKFDIDKTRHPRYNMPILLPGAAACRFIREFAQQPPKPSSGFFVLRKLMAGGSFFLSFLRHFGIHGPEKSSATRAISHQFAQHKRATGWLGWLLRKLAIVPSDSVQFSFNVQHDCRACGCDASGVTPQMQERQESDTIIHSIVHKDDTRFIIKTHGLHNAGLLRKYLPVALTQPCPLFADQRQRHDELAAVLVACNNSRESSGNKGEEQSGQDRRLYMAKIRTHREMVFLIPPEDSEVF